MGPGFTRSTLLRNETLLAQQKFDLVLRSEPGRLRIAEQLFAGFCESNRPASAICPFLHFFDPPLQKYRLQVSGQSRLVELLLPRNGSARCWLHPADHLKERKLHCADAERPKLDIINLRHSP